MSAPAVVPVEKRSPIPPEQRFVLRPTSYASYCAIADALGESRVRVTYHCGRLEFMTRSNLHERLSHLLTRLLEALTVELSIPFLSAGSTTLRRAEVDSAIEPDHCYYIENEPRMRGRDEIDLAADPPPDFAIEVEVSRTVINRMDVHAALGVAELWRFDGEEIHVHQRTPDGVYVEVDCSRHFPFLPLAEVINFVRRRHELGETELIRSFRTWVQEQAATGWPARERP